MGFSPCGPPRGVAQGLKPVSMAVRRGAEAFHGDANSRFHLSVTIRFRVGREQIHARYRRHLSGFDLCCIVATFAGSTGPRFSAEFMNPVFLSLLLLCGSLSCAQTRLEDGGHEIQLWTGGGHSVSGGVSNTGVWNAGARYGWILSRPHGPGFLEGRFEYAVDAVPPFLVFQPSNTAFGARINPLNLKWKFATRRRVVPYFELSVGAVFAHPRLRRGES